MEFAARISQSRFLRFAAVGGTGFFVNEAALFLAIRFAALGPYAAWFAAFLVAVTYTWWGNRTFTFADKAARRGGILREWAKFVVANGLGALVNLGIYSGFVAYAPAPLNVPYVGLAAGTIGGLIFNFVMSQRVVFRA